MISFVDGVRADSLAATDSIIIRGDGVFEAVRSYGGRLFALDNHMARLERSAAALDIRLPEGADRVASWARSAASEGGEGIVRIIVSRGDGIPGMSGDARTLVIHHRLPYTPGTIRLRSWPAPWHPAGRPWELSGIKTTSYAPNVVASRLAGRDGFDDALLISDDGTVLEGPSFSVVWVRDGVIQAPDLSLGILDSVTRRHVFDLAQAAGVKTAVGRFSLDDLLAADEVFALSTVKEVTPVGAVDDREFRSSAMSSKLRDLFRQHVIAATTTN
jgi:branched-subunit amino acid aminotransferase/4-amino-4-deoxychorismate lyase